MTPLLLLTAALAADPAAPAAMILEVNGKPTADQAGNVRDLDDGDLLSVGDRLKIPAGSSVKAYFRPSGPVVDLAGPAEAVVQPGKLETASDVAVRDPGLPARAAEGLVTRDTGSTLVGGLTLRGPEKLPNVHPVPGMTVTTDRPVFEWPAAMGETKYRVEVVTGEDGKVLPVWAGESADPRIAYPADRKPLDRGAGYRWRVLAVRPDGTKDPLVAFVPFKVLEANYAADLPAVRKLATSDDVADVRLAAEVYRSWAVHDEAVAAFEQLAEKRPQSRQVWELLANYYDQAGNKKQRDAARVQLKKLTD